MATLSCTVTTFALAVLVDIITGILGLPVVDDVFTDRGSLVPLRCGLRMD
jgi:hypothetical protein